MLAKGFKDCKLRNVCSVKIFVKEFDMKNLLKLKAMLRIAAMRNIAIIALVAVFGFSMAACGDGTTSTSLDGTWKDLANWVITINGSTGSIKTIETNLIDSVWRDAVNKGHLRVGSQVFRNLAKVDDFNWTGQVLLVAASGSSTSPIASGTTWRTCQITLSENGRTFECVSTAAFAIQGKTSMTYTRQ